MNSGQLYCQSITNMFYCDMCESCDTKIVTQNCVPNYINNNSVNNNCKGTLRKNLVNCCDLYPNSDVNKSLIQENANLVRESSFECKMFLNNPVSQVVPNTCESAAREKSINQNRSSSNHFTVFQQNIRFGENKRLQLEAAITELNVDVVCLTELALRQEEISHYCLQGYYLVSGYCRTTPNRGGGIGIFVKDNLLPYCKSVNVQPYCRDSLLEVGAFQLHYGNLKCMIICLYRAPSKLKTDVDMFVSMLSDLLEFTTSLQTNTIIVGDTNVCMLTNDYRQKKLMECITIFGMHSALSEPTRCFGETKSSIDNIFTNFENFKTSVHNTGLTDHHGTSIAVDIKASLTNSNWCYQRIFSQEAKDKLS